MDELCLRFLEERGELLGLFFTLLAAVLLFIEQDRQKRRKLTPATIASNFGKLGGTSERLFGGLKALFGGGKARREDLFKVLEQSLISGDVGVLTTESLLGRLNESIPPGEVTLDTLRSALRKEMLALFDQRDGAPLAKREGLTVIALVGVNGVGKTTTAGKLASKLSASGHKVLLGACDTFRAAAVEQLRLWGERASVEVIDAGEGAKPSTVAFTALQKAKSVGADFLILDTAGRLHTKNNLMQELEALLKLVAREFPGAPHETLLVVDSTSGQNALEQAKVFNSVAPLSGFVITKLDGTPRGGMLFAIRKELGIPVRYIGLGERAEDLELFDAAAFLDGLLESGPL